ncbi:cholecystokinin A receptor [Mytilus galloprovincialis]|uniref:Gastrin/cholecystokinin type B receptor n=3 Tax=Mytilus galloprovincialis TaxID=29158 RepID=A0A8B6FF75_MYTGA|nr:cholecystokinin A receptor [Mytilus galloprovincialis]
MKMDFNNSSILTDNLTDARNFQRNETTSSLSYILIVIYIIIFIAAVVGNLLVIFTLVHNKRMRTVTNVFLLNLAVSDLLLAVFCMPFTLIPMFLQNFIFGATMCVLIRYLQGVSVGVSCFTLVSISLERYFGICRPLRSRRWQTLSHAYKVIIFCWILAAVVMIPIAVQTKYKRLRLGNHRCVEIWEDESLVKAYTVFLDLILLFCPFLLMVAAYGCIISTLWDGIQAQAHQKELNGVANGKFSGSFTQQGTERNSLKYSNYGSQLTSPDNGYCSAESTPRRMLEYRRVIRHSNPERNRAAKLKVIRMLVAVCLEFFVCWTPLYVVLTWKIFHYESLKDHFSNVTFSIMFVLSYVSTTCNPITYCFMNQKFRQSFKMVLGCCHSRHIRRFSSHSTSLKLNGTKLSIMRSKQNVKSSPNDKNVSPDDHSMLVVIGTSSDGVAV